jgi:hypothetical protein
MSSPRDDLLREQLGRAISAILEELPYMKQLFRNPRYDLKKTIENEIDFLLGVLLGGILERYRVFLSNRQIRPTAKELDWINHFLFSRVEEFKNTIRKMPEIYLASG